MLRLDSSAFAITETGPIPVAEITEGSRVLCMREGKPRWVAVRALGRGEAGAWAGVRVFTDAGDLLLGASTALVTSNGLRTGQELADMRDPQALGRMEGAWPLLETAAPPEQPPTEEVSTLICDRLASLSLLKGVKNQIFRVGSHSQKVLRLFERAVIGIECVLEPGMAGWSWLAPRGTRPRGTFAPNRETLTECALALWQVPEQGRYRLSLDHLEGRSFTLAVLYWCGMSFRTDFRPRYSPLQVELELQARSTPHAEIQGVASLPTASLIEVTLAERGCYMVVSGLLCGQ